MKNARNWRQNGNREILSELRLLELFTFRLRFRGKDFLVYSSLFWKLLFRRQFFSIFHKNTDMVFSCIGSGNCCCFQSTFKLPVKNCFNFTDLRKFYNTLFKIYCVMLWQLIWLNRIFLDLNLGNRGRGLPALELNFTIRLGN